MKEKEMKMDRISDMATAIFFAKQGQLFDEPVAETEEEARTIALRRLCDKYHATGLLVDDTHLRLTKAVELAEDWNYGYSDGRGTGSAADREKLICDNTK